MSNEFVGKQTKETTTHIHDTHNTHIGTLKGLKQPHLQLQLYSAMDMVNEAKFKCTYNLLCVVSSSFDSIFI